MLTAMSKQRSAKGSKWTARSHWHVVMGLIQQLRAVGYPCSWARTFASQMWKMSRTPSGSSMDSDLEGSNPTSPSSEDDYLWPPTRLSHLASHLNPTPQRFPGDTTALREWPRQRHSSRRSQRLLEEDLCVCVCQCVCACGLLCFHLLFFFLNMRAVRMLTGFGEVLGISGLKRNKRALTHAGKMSSEHCRACF